MRCRLRAIAAYALIGMLGACGGGSSEDDAAGDRARPLAINIDGLVIPPDASTKGMWGPVKSWPLIPLHAVLLADGRVLSYGTKGNGQQTGYFIYDVWDPKLGIDSASHLTLPNGTATDLFCASQASLPTGLGVILTGGDNWTGTGTTNRGNRNSNVFTLADNSLTRGPDMALPRWYATSTVLTNGEMMIQGGIGEAVVAPAFSEIRGLDGNFRPLTGFSTTNLGWSYPRNFVIGDGRVFGFDTSGAMYYIDATGNGTIARHGYLAGPIGNGSSAAMFRPGKILQIGGSSNQAVVIDVTGGGTPVVTPTQPLASQRIWANATILADGKVLATGGSRIDNQLTDVAYSADIWDPVSGSWTVGPQAVKSRLYHSVAMLLPDGSVMVAGGGAPGPQVNTNVEIYYPPYLFTADAKLATRPTIDAAPALAEVGSTIRLDVTSARPIARVSLVRHGTVTHSFNSEQRFSELVFAQSGNRLAVQMPTVAGETPPGTYMLFAIDNAGVPSEARSVRIDVAANPNPAIVPVLDPVAQQNTIAGSPVSLQLVASDPNGDALTFSAAGLPAGLMLDPASGLITGTPIAEGSHSVVVTASDGLNAASRTFTWTVTGNVPIVVALTADNGPMSIQMGMVGTFAATSNGPSPSFSWDFGDGSPATAWSTSGTATHTFSQAGSYVVTVTARDALGRQASFSFIESVYLPAATGRPTASSSIAIENRNGASRRVWIVNQDNQSVSVFDESTLLRVAEINVGVLPRHVAIAANGRVWVTNKQTGSISIIDPATLAVAGTITLPRASQPHGLAMSPDGRSAYVALEATGQVMKYDTATLVRTATATVGANPRHLAVRGDGAELWVSRFITPPQPGESTLSVQSSSGTAIGAPKTGGEVLALSGSNLALTRTIVLEHSTREDSERAGRGVPNYLGALAISPDGTQAWVPSKQDNIMRGLQRDGRALNFQNTVRAIASRINLASGTEDAASRIDLDNAGLASSAIFDARGVYLFVALETSREIAVVDAHRRVELFRVNAGRAPQGLALAPDGLTLYVENFMDRSLGAYDLRPLVERGEAALPLLSTRTTVGVEKLAPQVLLGKQHFYDARDPRLARDGYMSCASCHNEAGHDGRVWDLASAGEGLRRTIGLRGKGRHKGHGFLHWSGNFDEAQDFEGQIRALAGGSGLMSDADYFAGTTSQPLGNAKAGRSADLDALAAYLASLTTFDNSPAYPVGAPPASYSQGQALFKAFNCAACHGGEAFSSSGLATLHDIGTLKPSSGQRLGATLTGIDPPTLRGVWSLNAFLHDGSAPTLQDAVRAHRGITIGDTDLATLVGYLKTIGHEEASAPVNPGSGTGLKGEYFANVNFSGPPALTRTEILDFTWGAASPGGSVPANGWSVRWSGQLEAPASGTYVLQVVADDGVRVSVNGQRMLDRLGSSSGVLTTTLAPITLAAGQRVAIVVEHQDQSGDSTFKLRWTPPGSPTYFVAIPAQRLYPAAP